MKSDEVFRFYVSCPPGLEAVLAAEYHSLDLLRVKSKPHAQDRSAPRGLAEIGGMEFEGPLEDVYRANLHFRSASRVIVRLGEFMAITFAELRKKTSKLEWEKFLRPGQPVKVEAVCHKSRLYHSDAVAERVLAAIQDHFSNGESHVIDAADTQLVMVRMLDDVCTISVDSSGELLHRRGYRLAVAKAPLRENLAAGMILASGWVRTSPLIDPFCGSGTIPIEAALISRNIAPGIQRKFQFMDWPIFDPPCWEGLLEKARGQELEAMPQLLGFDRDRGAIEMAKANGVRAGLQDTIRFDCQPVSTLEPAPLPGWLITNPPYGVRVSGNKDLRDLYARFGAILKDRFKGWHLGLLSGDEKLTANAGLGEPDRCIRFSNGGLPVTFSIYNIG